MNIAIACGGTGGHMFPGLAVADALRKRGHRVVLWLAGRRVELNSLAGWEGDVVSIKAAGFPSGVSLRSIGVVFTLVVAVFRCICRMWTRRPDVLLAMGSYASVGPVLAARCYRVPVVLHEANAIPGRAVSFLSRFASVVGVTFEAAAKAFGTKAVLTGLPLRADLNPRFPGETLARDVFTVLIMGGSQGAHVLNDIGSQAVCAMQSSGNGLQVVHLAGPEDAPFVVQRYNESGVPHLVFPFLEDMGLAYGAADLAVSRAGAASCMELAACGVPALLVPLPSARRDHQTANARAMVSGGGGEMVAQADLSVERLESYLTAYRNNPAKQKRMKENLKTFNVPDATQRLAAMVERAGQKPE